MRDWDASSKLDALSDSNVSTFTLVAKRRDSAWVELMLCINPSDISNASGVATSDNRSRDSYLAVPLAMHIEVGNGSWDASLIKRRGLPEGEMDVVTLNLVAVLR